MLTNLLVGALVAGQGFTTDISTEYPASEQNADGSFKAPGFMGVFRNGLFQVFKTPGTFTWNVPETITRVRARVVGRGQIHNYSTSTTAGPSGGGYAHGVFDVTPGKQFTIKIPNGINGLTESSFGNAGRGLLLRATNGEGVWTPGQGYGGDYQSIGGYGGNKNGGGATGYWGGGGGAGSQMAKRAGAGGDMGYSYGSWINGCGGGVVQPGTTNGNNFYAGGVLLRTDPAFNFTGLKLPPSFPRFPFDGFYGRGGDALPGSGYSVFNDGGDGGGARAGYDPSPIKIGGGMFRLASDYSSTTITGLVVIEW